MKKFQSAGRCNICEKVVAKRSMTRHLEKCLAGRDGQASGVKGGLVKTLHLLVEGRYDKVYWLHLEIPAAAKLERLDQFLRRIWLECCGHMSAFTIGDTRYSCAPSRDAFFGEREQSMTGKLYEILTPGTVFRHEYDFGTTTELELKVIAARSRVGSKTEIEVLARNDPPPITCQKCPATATQVCSACIFAQDAWLCDKCASKHECGEEMLLPVVNSPRVGMCGYCG